MIGSRKIEDLHPIVADLCRKWLAECANQKIDVIITSTYRDAEYQNSLYAEGRTSPGKIITNARAGQSFHNYRMAFDFVPVVDRKPAWSDMALIEKCGVIGENVGLQWAGRWNGRLRESLHLQFSGGLMLSELQSGKTLPKPEQVKSHDTDSNLEVENDVGGCAHVSSGTR